MQRMADSGDGDGASAQHASDGAVRGRRIHPVRRDRARRTQRSRHRGDGAARGRTVRPHRPQAAAHRHAARRLLSAAGGDRRVPPAAADPGHHRVVRRRERHDWTHHIQPHATYVQPLHVDAITDSPDFTFDIQLFWYPHDVAPGEGGTRFVPGSHLRRVRSSGLDRYQHIVGEQQLSGPAGTVVVFHHGLWHAGQPHPGDGHRWMHKVRLNPAVPQVRLWDTSDLPDLQNPPSDHVFARILPDSVAQVFRTMHPWMSITDHRNEQVQRARLWRYLTGDDTYDVDHYLTRLEARAALVTPARTA